MLRRLTLITLLILASSVKAAGLDISLSNDTAYLVYLTDAGGIGYGGTDVGFGLFYNEEDDLLLTGNFLVVGRTLGEDRPIQFGVGVKAYGGRLDIDEDILAIGIGAQARYVIPARTPMGISGEVYVAPRITAFGDTKEFREFNARFEIEIVPSASGYVGYRFMEAEVEIKNDDDDVELDDNFHFGIRLTF